MKKLFSLFLTLVIVFTFVGCSSEPNEPSELPESSTSSTPDNYGVFKDINEKSKQFTYLDIDFDSIEANDEDGSLAMHTQTPNNWAIFVFYDGPAPNQTGKLPNITHISIVSVETEKSESEFMDVCRSVLLIDEWGLTPEDLKNLPIEGTVKIHSPLAGKLRVMMHGNIGCQIMIDKY